jgi:hypothetical protein
MLMTQLAEIKAITKEDLERAADARGHRVIVGTPGSGKSGIVSELVDLVRAEGRPLAEVAVEQKCETSLILVIDNVEALPLDVLTALVQTVKGDRSRFSRLIEALMPAQEIVSPAVVEQGRRNAEARAAFLSEFPALSSAEVAERYGSSAKNRAALAQSWRKQGKVFAVPIRNGQRFPLFQFDEHGEPKPAIARVLAPLRTAGFEDWQVALWFTGALASLEDRRPVDLIDTDPERVIEAARHVAEIPQ